MLKKIISRITMVKSPKASFYDFVSKDIVYFWQDYYFDTYVASSRWGFRTKLKK